MLLIKARVGTRAIHGLGLFANQQIPQRAIYGEEITSNYHEAVTLNFASAEIA